MNDSIKQVVKIEVVIAMLAVLVFVILHKFSSAAGFLIGALWSASNALLTVKLIEIAVLKKAKEKLLLLLLIKFPVLYLLGFLILVYKVFPVLSLLLGAISIFLALGVLSLCRKSKLCSRNCLI
jgi:Na+/H+-translocating membrane pyrophosphatase